MKIINLILLVLFSSIALSDENTVSSWVNKENLAIVGSYSYVKETDKVNYYYFNIEYNKKNNCSASASVVSLTSRRFGDEIEETIKPVKNGQNKVRFLIDNKEIPYQPEKTILVKYSNGYEIGTIAPANLLTALQNNKSSIEILLEDISLIKFKRTNNFTISNKFAFENCQKNIKQ